MDFKDRTIVALFNNMFSNVPSGEKDDGRAAKFMIFVVLFAAIVLVLTGTDTVKVLHRKNPGTGELSYLRLFLNVLIFGGLGYYCLNSQESAELFFSRYTQIDSFAIAVVGWFYTILALVVLFFGIGQKLKADSKINRNNPTAEDEQRSYYPGESEFFSYLVDAGMSRQTVRTVIEPLSIASVGALMFAFNPVLGIPLLLCAASFWLVLFIDTASGVEDNRKRSEEYFANQPENNGSKQVFHTVN